MEMINLNVSTMIYRPIGQVFDFVSTPENDFQWQYGILESVRLSGGTSKIGTLFRSVDHLIGRRIESTFEVTEYAPNKNYGFKSLSGLLQSHTLYTFEIASGSTKVTVATQANPVNFFQIGEAVLEKKMKKQLKEDLAMLKEILEAKQVLHTAGSSISR